MNVKKILVLPALMVGAAGLGSVSGSIINVAGASAATNTPPTSTSTTTSNVTPATSTSTDTGSSNSNNQSTGNFQSNENTTHEAGESTARESEETAGQMPTVP